MEYKYNKSCVSASFTNFATTSTFLKTANSSTRRYREESTDDDDDDQQQKRNKDKQMCPDMFTQQSKAKE